MQLTARHYATGQPVRITMEEGIVSNVESLTIPPDDAAQLPFIAPGLFDIQVNGFGGLWFSSETLTDDEAAEIIYSLARRGVARCCPTLITNSHEALRHGMSVIASACRRDPLIAAIVQGIHLEGPWISDQDGPRGAHPVQFVRPADVGELQQLIAASDRMLRLLTIAPECPGVMELIAHAKERGIAISIGHTGAGASEIHAAAEAGATLSTHLGNGCSALMDRHHNPLWSQLADKRLIAGIISDGFHLPDDVLQVIVRCKGPEGIIVTCDVSGFAGCGPGVHTYGALSVEVLPDGRIVVAGQRQYLAGSGATTLECLPPLLGATGLDPVSAWRCVSENPERALGVAPVILKVGSEATFNVWEGDGVPDAAGGSIESDRTLRPVTTIVRGTSIDPVDEGTG